MQISDMGGEFAMLEKLTRRDIKDPNLVLGIGDDCAVLKNNISMYQLVTTDMLVEDDHFSLRWQTPYQVGMKLIEVNVSDIVCKGGVPRFAFLSMCLRKDTSYEFMDEFYKGVYASCQRHNVILAGGDTTHGSSIVFNIAMTGDVDPDLLRPRSGARVGDLICVTGTLGSSTAGLELLKAGLEGDVTDHLEPKARTVVEGRLIARYAHATIDVSDGLGSEVTHIAEESGTGAVIQYAAIPFKKSTVNAAEKLKKDPADFALYGGEDFEIVFTISSENLEKLQKEFDDVTVVGKILPATEGIYIAKGYEKLPLRKGYDHFV